MNFVLVKNNYLILWVRAWHSDTKETVKYVRALTSLWTIFWPWIFIQFNDGVQHSPIFNWNNSQVRSTSNESCHFTNEMCVMKTKYSIFLKMPSKIMQTITKEKQDLYIWWNCPPISRYNCLKKESLKQPWKITIPFNLHWELPLRVFYSSSWWGKNRTCICSLTRKCWKAWILYGRSRTFVQSGCCRSGGTGDFVSI